MLFTFSAVQREQRVADRRAAYTWRVRVASACMLALLACIAVAVFAVQGQQLSKPLRRFEQKLWSGVAPNPGSPVARAPDETEQFYLSRGPVVYLVEQVAETQVVTRVWVWRLEDAESVRKRWAPAVDAKWVAVTDAFGDLVVFERSTGRAHTFAFSGVAKGSPILSSTEVVVPVEDASTNSVAWRTFALPTENGARPR